MHKPHHTTNLSSAKRSNNSDGASWAFISETILATHPSLDLLVADRHHLVRIGLQVKENGTDLGEGALVGRTLGVGQGPALSRAVHL